MASTNGYMGKIGMIDLSSKTVSQYPMKDRERYLGGKILNQQILLELVNGQESAFLEETPIILSTGPLTGTGAPASLRFDIASLSPMDNRPAFSNCGGTFGLCLKKAGYDALILTGRCSEVCWLEISGDNIQFHNAERLWGTGVSECRKLLAQALDQDRMGTLCIGPAGENLVKFSSVMADGHSAGRAGIGAVMGWKNLKAITVTGKEEISLYDPEGAAAFNRAWYASLERHDRSREESGSKSFCTGCPLHCSRKERESHGILNELGMDSIAAADALRWAEERGLSTETLYEDIAYRRGIGDKLAEGTRSGKGKGGNRRGGSYRTIAAAFGLVPDAPETDIFCRCLTEAVSAAGQCMLSVNGMAHQENEFSVLPVIQMLAFTTGMKLDLEGFLKIGKRSLELEQQLNLRFEAYTSFC